LVRLVLLVVPVLPLLHTFGGLSVRAGDEVDVDSAHGMARVRLLRLVLLGARLSGV